MTESQIEIIVEKATDKLDRQLMAHKISQTQYDREIVILDRWAQQQISNQAYQGRPMNY